ncbi:MAG: S-methyl-5-thioribose-1-phosphate isomerase [Candidatus Omnitrophica bacterium]|nr:S-methyl-5-thioribose-1-phosphate isomerase [Candidatus Omnitrophota bacterium]
MTQRLTPTVWWNDGQVKYIDQTRLPCEHVIASCDTVELLWEAIRTLKIRGAPALGVAAALGVVLGIRSLEPATHKEVMNDVEGLATYLGSARPTAVNLFWALARMKKAVAGLATRTVDELKEALFQEAMLIIEEDRQTCRLIGRYGEGLIADGDSILTHCNAGRLATYDYGTALGVIYSAQEAGKKISVYADETRPLLQGGRLTAWELLNSGIDVTVICDNMAADLMARGKIAKVIVGADRIAANGDTANKIGTYGLAVLARFHAIPFYIAAPSSTFDLTLADGASIPVEQRDKKEVTEFGGACIAPESVAVYNPAFDVTPHTLISIFITDRGIIHPPFAENIKEKMASSG